MSIPLRVLGAAEAPQRAWETFLARRDELTGRMDLAVCDGCDGCGTRCTEGFLVTREEWEAVQAYLARQPESEVARVRSQPKTVPWPGAEESGATVTFCPFRDLERGNCFVYPARPTVCRLFGHTSWLPCPIGAVRTVPGDAAALWNGYRAFVRKTWNQWEETRGATLKKALEDGQEAGLP